MAMNLEVEIRRMGVATAVRGVLANFYYYGPDHRRPGGLATALDREVVHSHQPIAVLAALPERVLAAVIGTLLADRAPAREAKVVSVEFWRGASRDREQLCEPDFAVFSNACLVLGEVKTSPKSRTPRTPHLVAQLLNYMSLFEKMRRARPRGDRYPTRFAHLIVLPSMDLRWFTRGNQWLSLPSARGGPVRIDTPSCYAFASQERKQRYLKSPAALDEMLAQVPVICHSWATVTAAVEEAARRTEHEECARFALEIAEIARAATARL